MKNIYFIKVILFFSCLFTMNSCIDQGEWLDVKSHKSDVRPTYLEDYQALLDNDLYMNQNYPAFAQVSSDNSYVTLEVWQSAYWQTERNAYIWAPQIFVDDVYEDWTNPYIIVGYANIVLEGLKKIERNYNNGLIWDNVKGSALFYRAFAFYNLVQEFAKPYQKNTADQDLGIPLRLDADINEAISRASVEETYEQIIADLSNAEELLPLIPAYQTRPSQTAARTLLARVYLTMGDFPNALSSANAALGEFSKLIDFNTLDTTSSQPFPGYPKNKEIIFYSETSYYTTNSYTNLIVDSTLYQSYTTDDLRRTIFYFNEGEKVIRFKGLYTGSFYNFGGLASNELYFIQAESLARLGKTGEAMSVLNSFLLNRWKEGTFIPYNAINYEEALDIILEERRKELPFTGNLRWSDLRRLNKDPRYTKTLIRNLGGQIYTLPPESPRYVFDIPYSEIELSNIQQNERE